MHKKYFLKPLTLRWPEAKIELFFFWEGGGGDFLDHLQGFD